MIWKENYKVKVALIDTQHEELFTRVSSFVETVRSHQDWDAKIETIDETLNFMKDYVVTHFSDEEAYQEEIGYPAIEKHKEIHAEMVAYVDQIAQECEKNGYREIVLQQFAGKLVTWLINHVLEEDKKIADFAAKKGE
jgi:hemerythrin